MIDAKTLVYCIIGNPVRHSLSPVMHNAAFDHTGINAVYVAFEPASAGDALAAIKALGIMGASVTIPFKIDVMHYCDSVDTLAQMIGSVNTIVNNDGKLIGYNTDGYGLFQSLQTRGIDCTSKNILIIGNGGSARAIAFTLAHNNAHITICGRNPNNVVQLTADLQKHYTTINSILINQLTPEITRNFDIIINTTPVGMKPDTTTPINTELIHSHHIIVDIVYSPLMTTFLTSAKHKGCTIITGDSMLLYQACRQFELWTGINAPVGTMHNALKNALQ